MMCEIGLRPEWLSPISGLPKGCRWRDGQKFLQKRSRKLNRIYSGESYVFLPAGEDLYIKGIKAAGTHISAYPGMVIKNFRSLTCREIIAGCPGSPFLESSFKTFWHSQGLDLGYTVKFLRSPRHKN